MAEKSLEGIELHCSAEAFGSTVSLHISHESLCNLGSLAGTARDVHFNLADVDVFENRFEVGSLEVLAELYSD